MPGAAVLAYLGAVCWAQDDAVHVVNASRPTTSAFVPLKFVHADPSGVRGRRRRLTALREGISLHGNLHTLG